jgi:hypothetical protein
MGSLPFWQCRRLRACKSSSGKHLRQPSKNKTQIYAETWHGLCYNVPLFRAFQSRNKKRLHELLALGVFSPTQHIVGGSDIYTGFSLIRSDSYTIYCGVGVQVRMAGVEPTNAPLRFYD